MPRKQARYGQPAVYNSSPVTYLDGDDAGLQVDSSGNQLINVNTLLAGEDTVNNLMRFEQQYQYNYISTAVTITLKTGAGQFHALNVESAGATGNTITVYDNTAASGTKIAEYLVPFTGTATFNVLFTTGLTIVTAGTTPPNLTVSYR